MNYYDALHECGFRYLKMLEPDYIQAQLHLHDPRIDVKDAIRKIQELWEFILEFIDGTHDELPLMKLNRWLGYIQGCLIQRGYTTVQAERDWTRPPFRGLDFGELENDTN